MNLLLFVVHIIVTKRSTLYILYIKIPSNKAQTVIYNNGIRLQTLTLIEANITIKIVTIIIKISYFTISYLQK